MAEDDKAFVPKYPNFNEDQHRVDEESKAPGRHWTITVRKEHEERKKQQTDADPHKKSPDLPTT